MTLEEAKKLLCEFQKGAKIYKVTEIKQWGGKSR